MTPPPLRQRLEGAILPRHRHAQGYIAVVLAGGYLEAGDLGRRRVSAGDVVVHRPFDAHLNHVPPGGAQVLNLRLPALSDFASFGRVHDPDGLAKTAERDVEAALDLLQGQFRDAPAEPADWIDDLAATLARPPAPRLGAWAGDHGISGEHVARAFRRAYGVSPQRYRLEAQARRAWRELCRGSQPLAAVALDAGFSDQPHMTRTVLAVTGRTPGAWRRSFAFKTGAP